MTYHTFYSSPLYDNIAFIAVKCHVVYCKRNSITQNKAIHTNDKQSDIVHCGNLILLTLLLTFTAFLSPSLSPSLPPSLFPPFILSPPFLLPSLPYSPSPPLPFSPSLPPSLPPSLAPYLLPSPPPLSPSLPPSSQIYPYLVINNTQVARCRSEERVMQLLSMVNLCLEKDKVSDMTSSLHNVHYIIIT